MKLFVAGLPYDLLDEELFEIFGEYGKLSSAKIIRDRKTKKSKGYGFIEFIEEASANAAISALNGGSIDEKKIIVKVSN